MINDILLGFTTLFQPAVFIHMLIGFSIGMFFGIIPGLTATLAVALLMPLTFQMQTIPALVTVMAIYMSGIYSGSITATVINIPGAPTSIVAQMDGYPLMKKGQGAQALGNAGFASMIGGIIGVFILMFAAPLVSRGSLLLQSADRFSLVFFALVAVTLIAQGETRVKSLSSTVIGVMIGIIGIDYTLPLARQTFGIDQLSAGVSLVPAIIGAFAISEVLSQVEAGLRAPKISEVKFKTRDFIPSIKTLKHIGILTYIKSALLGIMIGALPGAGATMGSFVAYAEAKRSSKNKENFGKGEIRGLVAAETANNAVCSGAIIPLLTLGIPGDTVTAMVFGVLVIHGMIPGPYLITEKFHLITPMYAALMVSAVLCFLAAVFFGKFLIKIVKINRSLLYPFIISVSMVGAFASAYSVFQLLLAVIIGVIAYIFKRMNYPIMPIIMGMILGPMAEKYLRQAVSTGNMFIFFVRPASIFFLILCCIFIFFLGIKKKD
jgi:putative tricarboxylic transport membrane protein